MEGYMNNLLLANISNATAWGTILVIVLVIFLVIFFAIIAKFFKTWLRARLAKAPVSMSNMLGMWLRKVPYPLVVDTRITAAKAGLDISTDELEAHFLAGGDIVDCVLALIAAEKAGIPLSYDRACAIDLAVKGTSKTVLEAVRTSINPRVIDCPNPSSGQTRLTAVARDGIAVAVRARVTVRTNLDLFVGGATEETVVARVGEGIVSAVGSAPSYKDVLEKPEVISRTVSDKGVDAATAFEVLSIDIADVDVAGQRGRAPPGRTGGSGQADCPGQGGSPPRRRRSHGTGNGRQNAGNARQGGGSGSPDSHGHGGSLPQRQPGSAGLCPLPERSGRYQDEGFHCQAGCFPLFH